MSAAPRGTVVGICAGRAQTLTHGRRTVATAFVKEPIDGPVAVGELGIATDEHVYEDHGGPDMALLAYPIEHYAHWRTLGLDLPPLGAMGENLTVRGLLETDVELGDVLRVGTCVLQVCQPRTPCYKLAARFDRKDLPVLVQDTGFTGYLLRVLEPGRLTAGDEIELVRAGGDGVTVAEAGHIVNVARNDLDGARRVLAVPALGASVRRKLAQRVADAVEVGLDTERLFLPDE